MSSTWIICELLPLKCWAQWTMTFASILLSQCSMLDITTLYTGRHRINWTIQPFNQVYKNLHKITPLILVAHRQIRRQKRNVHLNFLQQCDTIADVIYENTKTRPICRSLLQPVEDTRWAALWLMFLVADSKNTPIITEYMHYVHYHTYVFCCRNTEHRQQK